MLTEREWSLATSSSSSSEHVNMNISEIRSVADAMYKLGSTIPQDRDRAIELWKQASDKGDARSKFNLAISLYMSNPKTIDRVEARNLLESALEICVNKNDDDDDDDSVDTKRSVMFALGTLEEAEKGDDDENALKLFHECAKLRHAPSCFKIAQSHQRKGESKDARQWYLNGAAIGHADCLHSLSIMYVNGNGGAQDHDKGFKLCKEAVNLSEAQNNPLPHAEFSMGNHYYHGVGTKTDMTEALRWWKKSAEKGFVFAQINLGTAFRDGNGCDVSLREARKWYATASESGSEVALKMLNELDEKYPHLSK